MARRHPILLCLTLVLAAGLILLAPVQSARACSLDGIASLAANGNTASLNGDSPTASTLSYWAPFTLLAAAPGDTLHLSENLSNVKRSIPKEALSQPFQWSFGDGTSALGQTVVHRYARTGWYKMTVRYYWPSHHQWVQFDSAEQHIVPSSSLLWTNLGYYAGRVFIGALRVVIWAVLIGIVALLVIDKLRPGALKRLRPRRRGAAQAGR
jgi:hypothetical protein